MRKSISLYKLKTILQGRGVGVFGALGSGTFEDKYCFDDIYLENNQINYEPLQISCGLGHTGVITKDKKVFIFGRPYDMNSIYKVYSLYRFFPLLSIWATKLTMLDENSKNEIILKPLLIENLKNYKIKSISCSGGLTVMLSEDGNVYSMGSNVYGQCGLGDDRIRFWRPIASVSLSNIVAIDTGLQHCIILRDNGEVYCWGKGKNGQMGTGDTDLVNSHPRLVPLKTKCIQIAAGLNHNVILDETGSLYIWGKRMSTELVENTEFTYKDQLTPRKVTLPNNLKVKQICCSTFTTVAIAEDNSLWVMGLDEGNSTVHINFQQVLVPLNYDSEENQNLTYEQIEQKPEANNVYVVNPNDRIKKGYYSVSLISACRQYVYDIAIKNNIARLHEIGLDFRKKGNILDFSMGFRHCLVVTEYDDEHENENEDHDKNNNEKKL